MADTPEPRGRARLPPLDEAAAAALLAPPYVAAGVAEEVALARAAGIHAVPVLLSAPAAVRLGLARALHAASGRPGPLVAAVGRRPPLHDLPAGATLYLDPTRLAPEARCVLGALLDDGEVWVVAGVEPGVDVPPPLAVRLAAVVVRVAALAGRADDVPALADAYLARQAARRGAVPPRLGPTARARLVAHAWPGDVPELEAVLARAVLRAAAGVVEAEHLGLDAVAMPAAPAPPDAPAPDGAAVEFLLAELAHELRNPLVTIKTYAQHLPAMLEDAALRERFATLAGEAIDRIDDLLENVLAFARLGPPRRQRIEVGPLLAGVLAELEGELGERAVRVRQAVGAATCAGDPEQVAYALRNLFAGVVREVPAREELMLDGAANGVVTIRFSAGRETAERLRRLVATREIGAGTLGDPTLLPLAFRLARAVLERNGGSLAVVPDSGDATTLVVRLPTAGGGERP